MNDATPAAQAKAKEANKLTFAQIKAKKKATTSSVTIQLDGEIASRIEQLHGEVRRQERLDRRENTPDKAPAMARELQALLDEAKTTEVLFTFKSVGRPVYDGLVAAHPPSKEQKAEGYLFDPVTFPPMLIAAASVEPVLTADDAHEIWDSEEWSPAELVKLFSAALNVNTEVNEIPFDSSVIARIANTEQDLITAPNEESLGASF